jgi:hypothetical protein
MQVHVPAASVIRRQMENRVNALQSGACHPRLAQVGLQKINFAAPEVLANIVKMSARSDDP